MDSISKSYKNKGDILNESKYVDKIINHLKNDLLGSRIELKKTFSLSTEEYFDILEYEVELINSLKGEIFDTSDPKWSGCGNYEFEFEIDKSHITDRRHPEDEYTIFKGDIIDIDVDVDVHGTVFLESSMLDNPGREWTIGEATNNKTIGYMIISEIRDVITTIIEQRLPILKNLRTLNICNVEEEWVTKLSNEGKGNINESVNNKFLDKVVNNLIRETKPTSEKHVSVITPFMFGDNNWIVTAHRCREVSIHPENYMVTKIITDHLRGVYSLQSIEEMEYVMDKYYFNLYNKYFRKFFDNTVRGKISESEDLEYNKSYWEKENQFFVKIVNQIMRETVIDYKNNVVGLSQRKRLLIKFPFDPELVIDSIFFRNINSILDSNISNISGGLANNFYQHCKKVYGLKYNEIKRLWPLYSAELLKHIHKVWGTMGALLPESIKSVGDNTEFLNKMADYVVDATELIELDEHPYIRIKYPFIDYGDKVPHKWYEAVPRSPFIVNMVDDYGIRKAGEADFILDKYSEKLRDKVKTKLP